MNIDGNKNTEADILSRCFKGVNYKSNYPQELPSLNTNVIKNTLKEDGIIPNTKLTKKSHIKKQIQCLHEKLMHLGIIRFKKILKKNIPI